MNKLFLSFFVFYNLFSMQPNSYEAEYDDSYEYYSDEGNLNFSSDYNPGNIPIDNSIRPFFKALGVDNYPIYNKKNLNTIDDLLEEIKCLLEDDLSGDTKLVLSRPFTFLCIALNVDQKSTALLNVLLSIYPFITFEINPKTNENIFDHLMNLEIFYKKANEIRYFLINKMIISLEKIKENKLLRARYRDHWKNKRYWKKILLFQNEKLDKKRRFKI